MTLLPLIGFAPRIYRWLYVRRINQLHRILGKLERELAQSADKPRLVEYQKRITEIESDVVRSGLHVHSKSICSDLRRICEWFKKTLVEMFPSGDGPFAEELRV